MARLPSDRRELLSTGASGPFCEVFILQVCRSLVPLRLFVYSITDVSDLSFSPDGNRLVSCDFAGDLVVWDIAIRSLFAS